MEECLYVLGITGPQFPQSIGEMITVFYLRLLLFRGFGSNI